MGARKRRNSSSRDSVKSTAAKQILKSLITLDPYESELAENVQNEGIWNEHRDNGGVAKVEQPLPSENAENEKDAEADAEADAEFERQEKERDAKLPEEYRKFRPKGFDFNIPPTDRPVRIYADGVFDLFHLGHMKQLEQAKKSLPNVTMVVGVPNDRLTHKYKGLTVLSEDQRYESLRHCRWVDEVVPDAPWEVNQEFLDKHKIDYVAHDDLPYAGPDGQDDVYKFVKEQGQFMATQRTDGISTSDIITKIVKDYDLYLMRNFKRGVSRKELNVSWIKKNELDIKRHVNEFRESWRNNVETTTKDLYADLLAYALNAPPTSVLGRARDWVSKRIDSRNGSPPPGGNEDDDEDDEDDDEDDEKTGSESEGEEKNASSPKRRRVTSK